jgi:GT2 family glycosyltransferase
LEDCSLVVPTYERPAEVVCLLECLAGQEEVPGEVVIVDGSRDRRTETALAGWIWGKQLTFDLRYVESPTGLTLQRNVGVDVSTRPLIFFLDDDCYPETKYFAEIRRVFLKDQDGTVGAVGGSVLNEMDQPVSLRWRIRFLLRLAPRDGDPGRCYEAAITVPRAHVKPFTGVRPADILQGGAAAYRRKALETERFSLFFYGYSQGEDVEMSLRLGRRWKLLWCGDARLQHLHASPGRPDAVSKGLMEVRNRYFIWKRYSPEAPRREQFRFWADVAFIFAYDIALFATARWRSRPLRHALGVARGAWGCWTNPPRYEEPTPRREFDAIWSDPPAGKGAA